MAEKKLFDITDPLCGVRESMVIDEAEGKRFHHRTQNVDYALKAAHEFRQKEGGKGQRFKNLIQKGQFKMLGIMPITEFVNPVNGWAKRPARDMKIWLEENPHFKTTNAKLDTKGKVIYMIPKKKENNGN